MIAEKLIAHLNKLLDQYQARYDRQPYVLDLVGVSMPGHNIFSPLGNELHYLDKTIDIVVAPSSHDRAVLRALARWALVIVDDQEVVVEWSEPVTEISDTSIPKIKSFAASSLPSNGKRVLFVAPTLPEYDREGGGVRLYYLLRLFLQSGYSVAYATDHDESGERYVRHLNTLGVQVYPLSTNFDKLLRSQFDLIVIAFWNVASFVIPPIRAISPKTYIVIDSIDLHFLREARAMFTEYNQLLPEFAENVAGELNAYLQADTVLTVSQKEAALINNLCASRTKAFDLPDLEFSQPSPYKFDERKGILFIGNFRHSPNIDAIQYFMYEIVPLLDPAILRKHPIYVVGNGPTSEVFEAVGNRDNIYLLGWVPSVVPYIERACVTVAPLRYGAGIKRKLLLALTIGTPTVTTPIGAEGLGLTHEEHILIGQDSVELACFIERLLIDSDLWHKLAKKGREHMLATHGYDAVHRQFMDVLKKIKLAPRFKLEQVSIDYEVFNGVTRSSMPKLASPDTDWEGYCNLVGEKTVFTIKGTNLRETVYAKTGTFNRQRQLICGLSMALLGVPHATLEEICQYINDHRLTIYTAEANGTIFNYLRNHIKPDHFYFSEYFGDQYTSGEIVNNIRHEDLQRLSFPDETFDIVLTAEVMEHIPDVPKAEGEIVRVLKSGGVYCFTTPVAPYLEHDQIKAQLDENGNIQYLTEPDYHGDPVRPEERILVFRVFSHRDLSRRFEALGCTYIPYYFSSSSLGIINAHFDTVQVVRKLSSGAGDHSGK
ncbi:MAG: glycosyltransferase [Sedimentisphaerales bacterium]|nr:glycosyltransferase [Sedimentisphaerales bacterium]